MTKTLTAAIALAQNNYTTTDLSAANTEYLIDDAIDYVNHLAGTSISNLTGDAGSKSVSLTVLRIEVNMSPYFLYKVLFMNIA